jgi:hypothetical protein
MYYPYFMLCIIHVKNKILGRHLWLMPVILATQEAKIRRIMV